MRTFLDSVDSDWYSQRLTRALLIILVAFTVTISRLLYLQVIEGKEYRRLSEINSIRLHTIDAPRGLVYDRNGVLMVDNRPSFNLYIVLKDAKPLQRTLSKLSNYLGEPLEDLSSMIRSCKQRGAYKPILLKEDIGRDTLAVIEVNKFDLPGVEVHISPRRHYLYGNRAAHLIGYMGEISQEELRCASNADCKGGDFIGKFGIEKAFETILRGSRGGRQVEVNATGQIVRILETVNTQPGENIYLTIDQHLQKTAEELLRTKAGAAIAIDPNNGEILAMASSPAFDPNLFVTGMTREQWHDIISNPHRTMENKAIQAEYPPASTYKIITAIAGLEEGVIDENTTFFCPGFYKYGNRVFRCWRHAGHGKVDTVEALKVSCDVFFYQVGEALGVDRLAWYAKTGGLGDITEVNLDRESRGLIPTADWKRKRFSAPWQGGETLSVAIGQGYNLVTPLQMAILAGAVGKGGIRYKPQLVKKQQTAGKQVSFECQPEIAGRIPIKASTLALVKKGLWEVVNESRGTAYWSRLKDVEFSGKTGTAQVVGRKSEGDDQMPDEMFKDHAWFVAFAPSDDPQIAVAVLVEHGEHGSSAAAPIAREIIRTYLNLPEDEVTAEIRAAALESVEEESAASGTVEGD